MSNKMKPAKSRLGWAQYKLKHNPTNTEIVFKEFLEEFKIPFRFQKGIITSGKKGTVRIMDFYVPRLKIIFEIDGEYHNNTNQQIKDFEREQEIGRKRKDVLFVRFTNKQILMNPEQVKNTVKEVYNDRIIDFYYIQNKRIGEKAKQKIKIIQ